MTRKNEKSSSGSWEVSGRQGARLVIIRNDLDESGDFKEDCFSEVKTCFKLSPEVSCELREDRPPSPVGEDSEERESAR